MMLHNVMFVTRCAPKAPVTTGRSSEMKQNSGGLFKKVSDCGARLYPPHRLLLLMLCFRSLLLPAAFLCHATVLGLWTGMGAEINLSSLIYGFWVCVSVISKVTDTVTLGLRLVGWGTAHWRRTCLARVRPWFKLQHCIKKKKKKHHKAFVHSSNILENSVRT